MAVEQRELQIGFCEAAADLSAKQFYCVKVTASLKVNLTSVLGEAFLGVLQNKPKANEVADISRSGVTKVVIGAGGLAVGQWMAAADGTAVQATAGHNVAGTVLIGGNAGELATVTVGVQEGNGVTLVANTVVAPAAGKVVAGGTHTTTAGEASANTLTIATGLTTITAAVVQVLDATNHVVTSDAVVTWANGNLTVADGATYNTVAGQIINWIAYGV